jgi:predicted O-linked N-acetylglucosamine transferase (SPINDLY family)
MLKRDPVLPADYAEQIADYETAIAQNPGDRELYWHYGLALLLDGQEESAQSTWLMVLAEAEEKAESWQNELAQVLEAAAIDRMQARDEQVAGLIRQQLRLLNPNNLENLLHLLVLTISQQALDLDTFQALEIVPALESNQGQPIDTKLLLHALATYLNQALIHPITVDFVAAVVPFITAQALPEQQSFVNFLLEHAQWIANVKRYPDLAIQLVQNNLKILPEDFQSLLAYANFSERLGDYQTSITVSQQAIAVASSKFEEIVATRSLIQAYLSSGQHDEPLEQLGQHLHLALLALMTEQPSLTATESYRLLVTGIHLPYIADNPTFNRSWQNQISALCEERFQDHHQEIYQRYQARHAKKRHDAVDDRPLKVGYLCRYFCRHSVGWLARWLLQNHNPDRIETYIYIVHPQSNPDSIQQQYLRMPANIRRCSMDAMEIANTIYQDDLDILVELDSLTSQLTCEVMAIKPAPIQVTWLGWDAVGMSSIDYFLADPYVLPEAAQQNYVEKIWRLPQTYIAIDHFEIGLPSINRQDLGIPEDAIVYLSAQRGYKRHPQTMQMQMKILQQVPNSYLLIKGLADQAILQTSFQRLAQEFNIDLHRIIFLPIVESEETHRANLAIADIVLDTFPYNGATTTLEALWLERPLITLVGEQFAARNSYTMLMNAGIEAGLSWSAAEYVDWGVRLGQDTQLRQAVVEKLHESKRSAPLWNVAAFIQHIEAAYRQMLEQFSAQDQLS